MAVPDELRDLAVQVPAPDGGAPGRTISRIARGLWRSGHRQAAIMMILVRRYPGGGAFDARGTQLPPAVAGPPRG